MIELPQNCYVNSTEEDIQQAIPAPELCGWKKNENRTYEYDWECQMVQRHVQDTIDFLTKGCGCKKRCQTQRCKCFKNKHCCGPSCRCQNCLNVSTAYSNTGGDLVIQTVKVKMRLKSESLLTFIMKKTMFRVLIYKISTAAVF